MDYYRKGYAAYALLKYLNENTTGSTSNEELMSALDTISEKTGIDKKEFEEFLKATKE